MNLVCVQISQSRSVISLRESCCSFLVFVLFLLLLYRVKLYQYHHLIIILIITMIYQYHTCIVNTYSMLHVSLYACFIWCVFLCLRPSLSLTER